MSDFVESMFFDYTDYYMKYCRMNGKPLNSWKPFDAFGHNFFIAVYDLETETLYERALIFQEVDKLSVQLPLLMVLQSTAGKAPLTIWLSMMVISMNNIDGEIVGFGPSDLLVMFKHDYSTGHGLLTSVTFSHRSAFTSVQYTMNNNNNTFSTKAGTTQTDYKLTKLVFINKKVQHKE